MRGGGKKEIRLKIPRVDGKGYLSNRHTSSISRALKGGQQERGKRKRLTKGPSPRGLRFFPASILTSRDGARKVEYSNWMRRQNSGIRKRKGGTITDPSGDS